MTELADVQDLGSCAARRMGSSPTIRSQIRIEKKALVNARTFFNGAYGTRTRGLHTASVARSQLR